MKNSITIDGITYYTKEELDSNKKDELSFDKEGRPFVAIRTYSAGVHIGYRDQTNREDKTVVLVNTRRIWKWSGAFTLSELALIGPLNPSKCRFSTTIPKNELIWVEMINITKKSADKLNNIENYKCENKDNWECEEDED